MTDTWHFVMTLYGPYMEFPVGMDVVLGPFSVRPSQTGYIEFAVDLEAETPEEAEEASELARKALEIAFGQSLPCHRRKLADPMGKAREHIILPLGPVYIGRELTGEHLSEVEEWWRALRRRAQQQPFNYNEELALLDFEQAASTLSKFAAVHLYRCIEQISKCYGGWENMHRALGTSRQDLAEIDRGRNECRTAHAADSPRRYRFNRRKAFEEARKILGKHFGVNIA